MPIPLPNLDDRTYAELMTEARARIPALFPQWTNHNSTDPGIVLAELLAWLTEMALYRLNEVPSANLLAFLELLNGPGRSLPGVDGPILDPRVLEGATHATIVGLRERYRAVTREDFEQLALVQWPQTPEAQSLGDAARIQRARCVARRNLEQENPDARAAPAPGHVSLVIVPPGPSATPAPAPELCRLLWSFLDARRLLTVRHHVVGPSYVSVSIGAGLFLHDDAEPAPALRAARDVLSDFFHPLKGGADRAGWPFGRAVYISEIYALLDQLALVDYVDGLTVDAPGAAGRLQLEGEEVVGVSLDEHELVTIDLSQLMAIDVYGNQYGLDGDQLTPAGHREVVDER
jgi:hypothetical protein